MIFSTLLASVLHTGAGLPVAYADQSVPERYRGVKVLNVPKGFKEKIIALTFDDGPDPKNTPKILDALDKYNAKATFFVIGGYAKRHQGLVKEEALRGHVVGSHTWSHPSKPSKKRAGPEIWWTAKAIYTATGQWPSVFRPPYGLDTAQTARLARSEGYPSIIWNKSGADCAHNANEATVYYNSTGYAHPGDIVLMHDGPGHWFTAAAVPGILKTLDKNGYKFVTVPEMLRKWDEFLTEKERKLQIAQGKVKKQLPSTAQLHTNRKS